MIEEIEGVKFVFAPITESLEGEVVDYLDDSGQGGLTTTSTKTPEKFLNVLEKLAKGFNKKIKAMEADLTPDEIEIEFSLGISKKMNAWIVNVEGQGTMGVKMKWIKKK
jgi:hypothetical protein